MHSILVPVDFSDASFSAFQYGVMLANQFFSQVKLLHISPVPVVESFGYSYPLPNAQLDDLETRQKVEGLFQEWEDRIPTALKKNIEIATTYSYGNAEVEISKYIQETPPSLLIMGTSQHNRLNGSLYGDVIKKVLPQLNCPLLIVPENYPFQPIQHIAFGTVFDDQDHEVIEELMDFAFLSEATIHCVHVGNGRSAAKTSFTAGLSTLRKKFNRDVKFHTIQMPDPNSHRVVQELLSFANYESIQMMTLLKHDRGFWGNLFHHSVVETISNISPIPILVFNLERDSSKFLSSP